LARLIPLLLFFAAIVFFIVARHQAGRPRDGRVFRPRAGGRPASSAPGHWVASRAELDGVRDAYSSAAIDPSRPLHRCGDCQATYHEASVAALRRDNGGRCALCGGTDLRPLHVA
jgi:hypothetical protein